jgi:hypothetical protein
MRGKRKIASVAFTGAAAAGAVVLGMPAAFAASAYNIRTSNSTTGANYHGAIKGAGTSTKLIDSTTKTTLLCPGATVTGTVTASKGSTPATIATTSVIFGTTSKPCTLSGTSIKFTAKAKAHLSLSKVTATGGAGNIKSITSATLTGDGNTCSATFGQAANLAATYTNSTQALTIPGTAGAITVTKANSLGCLGKVAVNNKAEFKGTFTVSSPSTGLFIAG